MSEISEFADRYIFPAVFEVADRIFPEFEFKKQGSRWVSGNGLKVDGSEGEKHKVYLYQNKPHFLKDYTRYGKEITSYLIDSGRCSSWIDAVKYLAREVGVSIPDSNLSMENQERIKKKASYDNLLESINDFFVKSLQEASSEDVKAHRDYLEKRGCSNLISSATDENHSNKVELGFIPSRKKLQEYLNSAGLSSESIDSLFNKFIGDTHKLAIPFRDHYGRIAGFAFRDIKWKEGDKTGKYLYSNGLNKSSLLFNLRQIKDDRGELIIVEGLLDALNASMSGISNIAALGSADINIEQIKLAKRYGAKRITLCLDNDKTGREGTERAIKKIVESGEDIKVFVATLPDGIKDPDELIKIKGVTSFRDAISAASAWYTYQLDCLFSGIDLATLNDKDRDYLIEKSIALGLSIKNRIDRYSLSSEFDKKAALIGLSPEIYSKTLEQIKYKEEEEKRAAELKTTIAKASNLINQGQLTEALELLGNASKHSNSVSLEATYRGLLLPVTEETIRETIKNKQESLSSGLHIKGEELLIPSGAITIVAAPTSHGKTIFLINLALNMQEALQGKASYFFSYEESREAIISKFLNTYINVNLSQNNRRSIESYFKAGDMGFISSSDNCRSLFLEGKSKFFNEVISSGKLNIFYSEYTAEDLIGAIHYLHKNGNAGAIFIDYIQLLRLKSKKAAASRQEELKQICLDLKNCAVETGLPIVLASQFNREVTGKDLMHPTKLGEAGDIERVTNLLIGFWNNKFPALGDDEKHKPAHTLHVVILKNRDGEAWIKDTLNFDGNTGKITNQQPLQEVNQFSASNKIQSTPLSKNKAIIASSKKNDYQSAKGI